MSSYDKAVPLNHFKGVRDVGNQNAGKHKYINAHRNNGLRYWRSAMVRQLKIVAWSC